MDNVWVLLNVLLRWCLDGFVGLIVFWWLTLLLLGVFVRFVVCVCYFMWLVLLFVLPWYFIEC